MHSPYGRRLSMLLGCVALLTMLTAGGCTSGNPFSTTSSTAQVGPTGLEPFASKVADFDDIEIPMDMKYDKKESIVVRTGSFEGGILAYAGRVELNSLKTYMVSAMENKQWKLAGEAQTDKTLLAFTKPNKTCMVVLEEGFGGKYGMTKAVFYVTIDVAAAGRLNPFGEPISN